MAKNAVRCAAAISNMVEMAIIDNGLNSNLNNQKKQKKNERKIVKIGDRVWVVVDRDDCIMGNLECLMIGENRELLVYDFEFCLREGIIPEDSEIKSITLV